MKKESWDKELKFLRTIIQKTELVKTTKWGGEVYTFNEGNVLSLAAFKNYVSLWFFNGVFLNDPYQVLSNSQEGKTKALRHWQFTSVEEMDENEIMEYIQEAIENEKQGKKWTPEKSGKLEIPPLLSKAFETNKKLNDAFEQLTPFKQKGFADYITNAKKDQTKITRIEKIKPLIFEGIGLNDKYRNK